MLTRREEDITEMEVDEKNTELFMEWLKGKEDKRDGDNTGRNRYRNGGGEEREITGGV